MTVAPCCICRPGCAGVDAEAPEVECNIDCARCLHGCPALPGETCCEAAPPEPWPTALAVLEHLRTGHGHLVSSRTEDVPPPADLLAFHRLMHEAQPFHPPDHAHAGDPIL